jgi:hypothetical protein
MSFIKFCFSFCVRAENGTADAQKNRIKFFEKVLDLINNDLYNMNLFVIYLCEQILFYFYLNSDQESVASIFESKKLTKVKLNQKQAKVFFEVKLI